jgi:transcriptional antiterminator NusG
MAKQVSRGKNWYVIHTYSGYEEAVARNLRQRIESFGMEDKIFNVIVPTEKKIKIKGGRGKRLRKKYILAMSWLKWSLRMIRGMLCATLLV